MRRHLFEAGGAGVPRFCHPTTAWQNAIIRQAKVSVHTREGTLIRWVLGPGGRGDLPHRFSGGESVAFGCRSPRLRHLQV